MLTFVPLLFFDRIVVSWLPLVLWWQQVQVCVTAHLVTGSSFTYTSQTAASAVRLTRSDGDDNEDRILLIVLPCESAWWRILFAVFAVNSCVRISPGTLATVFSIWLFKSKKTESVWINLTDEIFLLPVWPSPVNLWHQLIWNTGPV